MADDIAHLISEITRSRGLSDLGGAAGGSRANRHPALDPGGGRVLGWTLGSVTVVALAVALTQIRSQEPGPRRQLAARLISSPVAAASGNVAPMQTPVATVTPPPAAPAVAEYPRREFSYASKRVPLARVGRPKKERFAVSVPRAVLEPSDSALPPLDHPSPHLTGVVLERALVEDAVATRQLNLEQLPKRSKP